MITYRIHVNSSHLGWRSARLALTEQPYHPVHRLGVRYMACSSLVVRFSTEFDTPGEYTISFYVGKKSVICHKFISPPLELI